MFNMGRRIACDERPDGWVGYPNGEIPPEDSVTPQPFAGHDKEAIFIAVRGADNGAVQGRARHILRHVMQINFRVNYNAPPPHALILIDIEALRQRL